MCINLFDQTMGVKIFVSHVNAHQKLIAGVEFNSQGHEMTDFVCSQPLFPGCSCKLPSGPVDRVACSQNYFLIKFVHKTNYLKKIIVIAFNKANTFLCRFQQLYNLKYLNVFQVVIYGYTSIGSICQMEYAKDQPWLGEVFQGRGCLGAAKLWVQTCGLHSTRDSFPAWQFSVLLSLKISRQFSLYRQISFAILKNSLDSSSPVDHKPSLLFYLPIQSFTSGFPLMIL